MFFQDLEKLDVLRAPKADILLMRARRSFWRSNGHKSFVFLGYLARFQPAICECLRVAWLAMVAGLELLRAQVGTRALSRVQSTSCVLDGA